MKVVRLKFKELELVKTDFLHDKLHIAVHYEEDKQARKIEKIFNVNDNIQRFAKDVMTEIKNDCKKRYASQSMEENEFLSGIVNVIIEEHEEGFTEIKLMDGIRRLKDKISFFRKVKSASNYMSNYHDLNETRIRL